MFLVVNLKEGSPPVDYAIANMEIELERGVKTGVAAIKFIHGYGSNGQGGAICNAVRKRLTALKKQRKIKDFILGYDWNTFDKPVLNLIYENPEIALDEDLNHHNGGITIAILK